jgi:hypothetical protein
MFWLLLRMDVNTLGTRTTTLRSEFPCRTLDATSVCRTVWFTFQRTCIDIRDMYSFGDTRE